MRTDDRLPGSGIEQSDCGKTQKYNFAFANKKEEKTDEGFYLE